MGRQHGWLTGREPGGGRSAPAPSRLARLRSCGERARRHEPLQKRKRTSSSELWPRPSARTGTSCERRRQPRAPAARARLPRLARPPRGGAGEGTGGGGAGRGGWGGGRRALPLHVRAARPPARRRSQSRGPGPAPPRASPSPSHLPGRWPVEGAGAGAGPRRGAGLRGAGPREASATLLSRARAARVGHRAGCADTEVEPQGGIGHPGRLGVEGAQERLGQRGAERRRALSWLGEFPKSLGWRIVGPLPRSPGERSLTFLLTPGPSLTMSSTSSCAASPIEPPFLNSRWQSLGEPLTCRLGWGQWGSTEGLPHPGSISVNTRSAHQP